MSGTTSTRPELAALCASISRLMAGRWGRGPRRCRGYWAGDDALLLVLEDGYTPAERALAASGHSRLVEQGRHAMYEALEEDLRGVIREAVGREVETMLIAERVEVAKGALVFMLSGGDRSAPEPTALR